jgi:hypothetical protein
MDTITDLHAHIDYYATDCDGSISRDYIMWPNPEQDQREDYDGDGEISFRQRVLCHIVSAYTTWAGDLKVYGDEMGGLTETMEWSEQTEEGGRSYSARFCRDDCADEEHYRDHTAESMGY